MNEQEEEQFWFVMMKQICYRSLQLGYEQGMTYWLQSQEKIA